MPEEYFDVVDENDVVIGRETRFEVHRQRLRHRSVHILVFNSHAQILLQKRSRLKDCNPGLWDTSISGHVDSGEDYADCCLREGAEELGLKLEKTPEFLFKLEAGPRTGWEFSCIYRAVAEGPFQPQADEIDEIRWFDQAILTQWIQSQPHELTGSFRLIWQRFQSLSAFSSHK